MVQLLLEAPKLVQPIIRAVLREKPRSPLNLNVMHKWKILMEKFDINNIELNVSEKLRPSLERKLTGTTKTDIEINFLPIPKSPFFVKLAVLLLRGYRKVRPQSIGNRCVFEPSCSHYSELAIRENGVLIGTRLTINRLSRCRPNEGGLDLSCKKEQSCNIK